MNLQIGLDVLHKQAEISDIKIRQVDKVIESVSND